MNKLMCGLALSLLFSCANAKSLNSFEEVTQYLSSGNEVNILVDLNNCDISDSNENKIPLAKWFIKPETVVYNDSYISTDGVKFAPGSTRLPSGGLLQRGAILVDNKGSSNITLSFFDAESNKKIWQDVHIQCRFNNGLQFFTRA